MKRDIPRMSGIYQILCVPTGKIYIGSAVDIHARWHNHRLTLRRGKHRNPHLQAAWNLYGEDNFAFTVLEVVNRHELLSVEQKWLDRTHCTDRAIGFNIYPIAGSPGETHARVWHGFIDPGGNEVTISNLHEFCRLQNLDHPSMIRLAQGKSKLKSYKGWTHGNSVRKRPYIKTYEGFVDPHGRIVVSITNLAAFCREHGLDKTHMVAVAHGRLISHRGWTYDSGRKRISKIHKGFVSPTGEHIEITNLALFCREHKLNIAHMFDIKRGIRRSHKGWTWRASDEP